MLALGATGCTDNFTEINTNPYEATDDDLDKDKEEEETTPPDESTGGETDTPPEDGVTNTEPIGGTVEGTITIEGTEGTGVIDNAA